MTILAYGAEQVRALEFALGGKPPEDGSKQVAAELNRHVQEQFERRKANFAKANELFKRQNAPLLDLLRADKRAGANLNEALPKLLTKPKERPLFQKVEPRMVTGSGFWLKVPPYDGQDQNAWGDAAANSDAFVGNYSLWTPVSRVGATGSAWAGLAINFFAIEDNPNQRFAAMAYYDYGWFDISHFTTAHNDATTNIWIWGFTENRWVLQQGGLSPSWTDGTGWAEAHGSGGDGSDQSGIESLEVFFPAFGNNWYQAWVWSWGSWDSSADFFNPSAASQAQFMHLPFVIFGSL